jgi:hypothetical protein
LHDLDRARTKYSAPATTPPDNQEKSVLPSDVANGPCMMGTSPYCHAQPATSPAARLISPLESNFGYTEVPAGAYSDETSSAPRWITQ